MQPTPLTAIQQRRGAALTDVAGWAVAARFAGVESDADAARNALAVADRSHYGRILARGNDTLDLLNRLSTNLVDPLPEGAGQTTVITTGKGRVVDWVTVLPWGGAVLILTSPLRREAVAEWIEMFTFEEDTTLEDVTGATAMVSLIGPQADAVIASALGVDTTAVPALGVAPVAWRGGEALVARTNPAGQPGWDVVVPAGGAEALWDAFAAAGAAPIGADALDALRIEARIPRWGAELSDDHNPLEVGLLGEISWNKGCYTGQEVVARLYNYERIQRHLAALELPAGDACPPGAVLMADGVAVGRVTSVSAAARGGVQQALALVRAGHAAPDTTLAVGESGPAAHIVWSSAEAQQLQPQSAP